MANMIDKLDMPATVEDVLKEVTRIRETVTEAVDDGVKSAVRALKQGRHVVVTMDGPRGPVFRAKPGVLRMAQEGAALLVPVACAVDARWRLKSWDRTLLPPPFARVGFALGEPLQVGPGPAGMLRLQDAMLETQAKAQAILSQ